MKRGNKSRNLRKSGVNTSDIDSASQISPVLKSEKGVTKKMALLVLGMHRSGTSSLAGTLVALGAQAPRTLMGPQVDNERGFFESISLVNFNDELLSFAGSDWDDWRALPSSWYLSEAAQEFEQRAVTLLAAEFGSARLATIKDPRICRMMPFWSRVLDRAGYDVRVLIPVRSPLEVAHSLRLRNGFPISKGLLLWLRHVLDAEAASRIHPTAIIKWGDFLADWRLSISLASQQIGANLPRLADRAIAEVDHFLEPSLRHNSIADDMLIVHPDVNDWVRITYKSMVELTADPSSRRARQRLDEVRCQFEKASKIFGRVFVDFEENCSNVRLEATDALSKFDRLLAETEEHRARAELTEIEREALVAQLAATCAERDQFAEEAAEHLRRVDLIAGEREALVSQLAATCAERDQFAEEAAEHLRRVDLIAGEREALVSQLAATCAERDQFAEEAAEHLRRADLIAGEREALVSQLAATCAERDQFAEEAAEHLRRADLIAGERHAAANERNSISNRLETALTIIPYKKNTNSKLAKMFYRIGYSIALKYEIRRLLRAGFDECAYLNDFPDVAASNMPAALHYVIYGRKEGRMALFRNQSR